MKKEFLIILLCALGISVFIFRDIFSSSDKKAIERVLNHIEDLLEFNDALRPLDVVSRLSSMKPLIHKSVVIEISLPSFQREVSGYNSIKTGALYGSKRIQSNSIHRLPTKIQITGDSALIDFNVIASAIDSSGKSFRERFQVNARMSKHEDTWNLVEILISQNPSF